MYLLTEFGGSLKVNKASPANLFGDIYDKSSGCGSANTLTSTNGTSNVSQVRSNLSPQKQSIEFSQNSSGAREEDEPCLLLQAQQL